MLHQLELQINQAHGIDGRFTAFCHATMDRWKELGDGRTLLRSLDPTYAREKLSNVYDQTKC